MVELYASVVIPVYNNFSVFKQSFMSLIRQADVKGQYEIVIIDDCSTDGTADYFGSSIYSEACVEAGFDPGQVRYIRNSSNLGRARTRNIGISNSSGILVIFLDADNIPSDTFVAEHIRFHRSMENTAAVGNVVFRGDYTRSRMVRFWMGRYPGSGRFNDGDELQFYYPGVQNGSVKRDELIKQGMFDEAFVAYGGEDEELWYRLCVIGGNKSIFLENAVSYHEDEEFTYDRFLVRIKRYGRLAGPLMQKKHPNYFKTEIRTRLLEPPRYSEDAMSEYLKKCLIRVFTGFPIGTIVEFLARISDKRAYLPVPLSFYGLVFCRYYIQGTKERTPADSSRTGIY